MKVLFLVGLSLCLNVFAQTPAPKDAKVTKDAKADPCATVIENNCPSMKGKTGLERLKCLGKQYNNLKGECKASVDEETKHHPCLIATIQLCPKNISEPTGNKNLFCLDQHIADVDAACKAIVEKRPKAKDIKAEIDNACDEDHEKFCKGLTGDESNKCLDKNFKSNKVSSECNTVLKKFQRR